MDITTYALAKKQAVKEVPGLVDDWLEENVDPSTGYVLDNTLTLDNAAPPASAVGDLKSAFLYGIVPVDFSDIRNAFIDNDLTNSNSAGQAVTFTSSTVTKTVNKFCEVEANVEYELNIKEGNTLSNSSAKRIVLTDNNDLISKQFIYNPTAAKDDIITFTPEINGFLCVCVDANYDSISIRRKSAVNPLPKSMVTALDNMFKVAAYSQDASDQYDAFRMAYGIPLYPLANGTAITTGGDVYTVTNGNHVKLELVAVSSGKVVMVNLLDISKNDGKGRDAGEVNNLPLAFSIPSSSEVVFSLKNVSGINKSIFYSSTASYRYYTSNLRIVNSSTSALPNSAITTDGTLCANNVYGINHNFSGADIGSILFYLPSVKSACTIEFDVELLVNGVRYV